MNPISNRLKDIIYGHSIKNSDDIKTHGPLYNFIEDLENLIEDIENGRECECGGRFVFIVFDGEKENFYCYKCNKHITYGVN